MADVKIPVEEQNATSDKRKIEDVTKTTGEENNNEDQLLEQQTNADSLKKQKLDSQINIHDQDEDEEEEEEDDDEEDYEGEDDDEDEAPPAPVDRKGKGKMVIEEEDDDDDDSSEGTDLSSDDSDCSEGLEDDPLAEVDLDNILPSRTRRNRPQPGLKISGGDSNNP